LGIPILCAYAEPAGDRGSFGAGLHSEFAENCRYVVAGCAWRYEKARGDLGIAQAIGQGLKYRKLPVRQASRITPGALPGRLR